MALMMILMMLMMMMMNVIDGCGDTADVDEADDDNDESSLRGNDAEMETESKEQHFVAPPHHQLHHQDDQ